MCDSDNKSVLGKTKTAPGEDDDVDQINLAVFSLVVPSFDPTCLGRSLTEKQLRSPR
ncbi:hypothetical protein IMZ48_13590 [Candidatus Bathyarchaeota archaeon]|nr:hypothetical protein [Candidatus Bathyarchaeota archaeon]